MTTTTKRWPRTKRLAVVTATAFAIAGGHEVEAGLSQQGLSQQGLSQQGLSQQGLSQQGLSQQGLSQQGLSQQGLSQQGLSQQGLSQQGLSQQGLSQQGLSQQGLSQQGLSQQGVELQGLSQQGLSSQGLSQQGLSQQGLSQQSLATQNVYVGGPDIQFGQRQGAQVAFVTLRGTTPGSTTETHAMALDAATGGPGSYIAVGAAGASAAGHYAVAHMEDAAGRLLDGTDPETVDLYIASVHQDTSSNLFHEPSMRANRDVWLYTVYAFHPMNRQWISMCPIDPATGTATAVAIAEDPYNPSPAIASRFAFSCTATGVAAKCARNWGYKPWRNDARAWTFDAGTNQWLQEAHALKPFYDACKIAARAAYCQDTQGFTKNGTTVDLYDSAGLVWSNAAENPNSRLMFAQEYSVAVAPDALVRDRLAPSFFMSLPAEQQALVSSLTATGMQRSRYRDIAPNPGDCRAYPWIDRLEKDLFEDARWMSFVKDTPRIVVLTPTYCGHSDGVSGPALAWDCNRCTKRVCQEMPACCDVRAGNWGPECVAKRGEVCLPDPAQPAHPTTNPPFPPGIAIPAISDTGAPLRLLTGPIGAVESIEGSGANLHIRGWACDPSNPDVRVRIHVYRATASGEPGTQDIASRGRLADLPADPALAEEIRQACGDPPNQPVRRMFDIDRSDGTTTLAISGKIFVYADDAFPTLPGQTFPAALTPPTLLRNGIRVIGRCEHGEYSTGTPLDAACSACATKVCAAPGMAYCCDAALAQGWDTDCVAIASGDANPLDPSFNAHACTAAESSATVHPETFSVVRTGWIEAPATGDYVFYSDADDNSRLWVNGQLIIDRWGPAPQPGKHASSPVSLIGGVRYHIRWDYFEGSFESRARLSWHMPLSTVSDEDIETRRIYNQSPGAGNGLDAQYFEDIGFGGAAQVRKDATIDFRGAAAPAVSSPDQYSARWTGLVMAPATDDYRFVIVGDGDATLKIDGATVIAGGSPAAPAGPVAPGCASAVPSGHDICVPGDKLPPGCHACVDTVCAVDPYCCLGGYVSPYASEPAWDAKCVAQVTALCGLTCPNEPVAARTTRVSAPIALKSGVKHTIELEHQHMAGDTELLALLWQSSRIPRSVVAQDYLFSEALVKAGGSGFNAIYYNNNDNNGVVAPALANPSDARHEPVFQTTLDQQGPAQSPAAVNLPPTTSTADWTPPPPAVHLPVNGSVVHDLNVAVDGHGIQSWEGTPQSRVEWRNATTGDAGVIAGGTDAHFVATLTLPSYGVHVLEFRSRIEPCTGCALLLSAPTTVTVEARAFSASNRPEPPIVTDPKDPTHATSNVVRVAGVGLPNATIRVTDEATAAEVAQMTAPASGHFETNITLADGWHSLVFRQEVDGQASDPTAPVYVSVRIPPPAVQFPPTGTVISSTTVTLSGAAGGSQDDLGRIYVAEMDGAAGHGPLNPGGWAVIESGGTYTFTGTLTVSPGKHLLLVYQTTVPDGLYPFVTAATTPTSRVEIDVVPGAPTITTPVPNATQIGGAVTVGGDPGSAFPGADVNVYDGPQVWTQRVAADGSWSLELLLSPGWHDLYATQVINSLLGGGWMESVRSALLSVGVISPENAPALTLPAAQQLEALGPTGRAVSFPATATSTVAATAGAAIGVVCTPPSGSMFAIGTTDVECTATDAATGGGTAVGSFSVVIVDGAPVINAPTSVIAEATDSIGAFVSFPIIADDAVSGVVPVSCTPASDSLFLLDTSQTVTCEAFDGAGNRADKTFPVTVVDTTPPAIPPAADVTVVATGPDGAQVVFPTPAAADVVDGTDVVVTCTPASGAIFRVGPTPVSCSATDSHLNTSQPVTFTVTVTPAATTDTVPPVLVLPADINATATSIHGAVVSYPAPTAIDAVDGPRPVTCSKPSAIRFPPGATVVTCSATDKAGNPATGSFTITVTFSWSGFLPPVTATGGSTFKKGQTIPVKFKLTGASARIDRLVAKLFAAKSGGGETLLGSFRAPCDDDANYVFNLSTKAMAVGAWQLRVDMGDGVSRTADITLR